MALRPEIYITTLIIALLNLTKGSGEAYHYTCPNSNLNVQCSPGQPFVNDGDKILWHIGNSMDPDRERTIENTCAVLKRRRVSLCGPRMEYHAMYSLSDHSSRLTAEGSHIVNGTQIQCCFQSANQRPLIIKTITVLTIGPPPPPQFEIHIIRDNPPKVNLNWTPNMVHPGHVSQIVIEYRPHNATEWTLINVSSDKYSYTPDLAVGFNYTIRMRSYNCKNSQSGDYSQNETICLQDMCAHVHSGDTLSTALKVVISILVCAVVLGCIFVIPFAIYDCCIIIKHLTNGNEGTATARNDENVGDEGTARDDGYVRPRFGGDLRPRAVFRKIGS